MYKKIAYFVFIILLSCSSSDQNKILKKKIEKKETPEAIYIQSIDEYNNGRLQNAIDILSKIEKDFSYSNLAPKALLMKAYIYYEGNDYIQSLEVLKKFKKLYPASINLAYAEFLTGVCLYEQISVVSKDQSPAFLALKQFNMLIKNFPNAIYVEDSKMRIDLINEQLAGKELYLARYYMGKEKWIAAIIRLQNVIEKYSNTIFIEEALHRMVEINYRIGNLDAAKKYAAILGYNYNNSEWYKKTYKIIGDKSYTIINQQRKKNLKDKLFSIFNLNKND